MEGDEAETSTNHDKKKISRKFKSICVFCGSRAGFNSSFTHAALQLGELMVEEKINLVYGGGSIGLMGLISETVNKGGCHVLGVIPKALVADEISGKTIGELKIVADMHQRKSEMSKHVDAFIALPDGYYDSLLALFDKGVEDGFIDDSARNIVLSANTPQELMKKMENNVAAHEIVASRQNWEVDQSLDSTTSGELV